MQNNTFETLIGAIVVLVAAGFLYYAYAFSNSSGLSGYELNARLAKAELTEKGAAQTGQTAEQIEKTWTRQIALDRLGRPEEIADTIVWLASDRASYITGQTILVDGGMYKGL